MTDDRAHWASLFATVRTILASMNVVFDAQQALVIGLMAGDIPSAASCRRILQDNATLRAELRDAIARLDGLERKADPAARLH